MSLTLSSAHVHTTWCDGKSPAADMARAALENGFVSLGFSSHAPQTFDPPCCVAPEKEEAYRAEILSLRREYADKFPVYLGTERDLYSCAAPGAYDYFIASVHYFMTPDGRWTAIDGAPEPLKSYVDAECGGDGLEMARRYFALLRDYVLDARPPVIGHFDLVRKNNFRLRLYDEDGDAYRRMALDALRPLAETGALLEVNTGAMARGYLTTPYPAPFLLREWRAWGGKVTVASDCHNARFLDAYYDDAEALLRAAGYRSAVRLGRRSLWEEYSL